MDVKNFHTSEPPQLLRYAALIVGGLDTAAWLFLARLWFLSTSDPAIHELDNAFGWAVTLLLGVTALPALLLAAFDRAPRTALSLAITFPLVFFLLFGALVRYLSI